ncbi:MAG: hypothetical protein A2092_14145 [Rhodobacteraceae bacterium GWE1_64_9]|nr:MAG: hypothetical protein A2092_14145 [Rhodobacteraceae bacterium GWE1_64_9]OHC50210.1 MAG: hypothetical protein A2X69_10620 [Rhodobacteraceae bacterium GWF1_65_7]HBU15559.1 hypothetical protein [Gemmobacter sp.]
MQEIPLPTAALVDTLLPAFAPCPNFGHCVQAQWLPSRGHVPRGFLGATGRLQDVRAILIFAEPGRPYPGDDYSDCPTPMALLQKAVAETCRHMRYGTDIFHQNLRWLLDEAFPGLGFEAQLRHVWMTEGRLCSIAHEIGGLSDRLCARAYLSAQLELMPQALIIPFGGKARDRVARVTDRYLPGIYALSPPGANHRPARPSWQEAAAAIRAVGPAGQL